MLFVVNMTQGSQNKIHNNHWVDIMTIRFWLTPAVLLSCLTANPSYANPVNAVALEQGTVLTNYTSEYGGRGSDKWVALSLIDGNEKNGWSSAKGKATPNEFHFVLAENYKLNALEFDNRNAEESSYPGIAATDVAVTVASSTESDVFTEIFRGKVFPTELTSIPLNEPITVRQIKLTILGNGGYANYTELMEFSAYGKAVGTSPDKQALTASYETNWGLFFIRYENDTLRGCYDHDGGTFTGSKVGGLLNIEWREGDQAGSAVLAITEDASHFNGIWYEKGLRRGTWVGKRADDQSRRPKCAKALIKAKKSLVAESLDNTGSARLYGIYFDFNSDVIKPESDKTLKEILAWLEQNTDKSLTFEGHTDSQGSDDYNLTLSRKRAAAVSAWLTNRGIESKRLSSSGLGESQPVADNATANGRSLNRRVEVRIQ